MYSYFFDAGWKIADKSVEWRSTLQVNIYLCVFKGTRRCFFVSSFFHRFQESANSPRGLQCHIHLRDSLYGCFCAVVLKLRSEKLSGYSWLLFWVATIIVLFTRHNIRIINKHASFLLDRFFIFSIFVFNATQLEKFSSIGGPLCFSSAYVSRGGASKCSVFFVSVCVCMSFPKRRKTSNACEKDREDENSEA